MLPTVNLARSDYRKQQPLNKAIMFQICQKGVSTETMETCLDPPLPCTYTVPNLSVSVTSNPPTPVLDGTNVTVTCTVEMGEGVSQSDLSLLIVDTQLSRSGTPLNRTGPVISGTTFTYTLQLYSFSSNDSGAFNCTPTVRPQQTSTYITGVGKQSAVVQIEIG